jgi:hypothetical protein
METLCSSKGQILELDQSELDPAELARAATQMAIDDIKENQQSQSDRYINNELKTNIPPRDLFNQRLIDNTQDFDDQVRSFVLSSSYLLFLLDLAWWYATFN